MQKELPEVLKAAFDDEAFREDLLRDHRAALQNKGWELSAEDMKKLDDFMAGNQIANAETILRAFSSTAKGDSPWVPPPWSTDDPMKSQ